MLEIQQTGLDAASLPSLGSGFPEMTSASGEMSAPPPPPDQVYQSDKATFLSAFNQLSEDEQQEVIGFLNKYAAATVNGENADEVAQEMPDFIKKMLQKEIGSESELESPAQYTSSVSANYQLEQKLEEARAEAVENNAAATAATEMQLIQATLQINADTTDGSVLDASTEAANEAPSDLQQMADENGEDLASLLKQYLDAGMSKEVAYQMVKTDLRNSGSSTEETSQKPTEVQKDMQ